MNLNKLFPRLTISAKLAIAFVLVAMIPLAVVGTAGTRSAVLELRASGEAALQHDMDLAYTRTARSLRDIEQHVTYVAEVAATELGDGSGSLEALQGRLDAYVVSDPSPIFRFKIIDEVGMLQLAVDRRTAGGDEAGAFEPLYQWTAAELTASGRAFLPIEVRGEMPTDVIPAIAVVVPLYVDGRYHGAVIGEAEAQQLFADLDLTAPGLEGGTTALVDEEGRFLFHSDFKREWGSLLLGGGDVTLHADLPLDVASRVMNGDGAERLADGRFLSYRSIPVGSPPVRSLVLYRTLSATFVDARIRRFLLLFSAVVIVLGAVVLSVSAIAARQITRPVYALTRAARDLTDGAFPEPVQVRTNDELEDLANHFNEMSAALTAHREQLESLVEQRTKRLLETEAHLGRIVTDAADAILALSRRGEITLWNRGAEELFGYAPSEALGRSVAALLAPRENGDGTHAYPTESVVDEQDTAVNFRTRRRTKAGEWIPVAVTKSPLHDEDGRTLGHSLIIRDERAREMLEEQMRRSERLATISVMAGGIAHELNNPLSIIGNRIELMQREAIMHDAGVSMLEDLEVLRKHVGRIGSVTSDLIKFARDEADELGPIDVNTIVERVTRLLGKVMREGGVQLDIRSEDDLPAVLGSESVVETVLVNLLLNAQQATPPGGEVVVSTSGDDLGTEVRIEVRDSGPGVPEDLRLRIFEPFFTTKADRGGTGLGLAVCRALVDRVGGTLDLMPSESGGARFVVTFPQQVEVMA